MTDDFPADVRKFLLENIDSVEQLEVLLLLKAESERSWNADEVSQKLCTASESAAKRLADLATLGLISVQQPPLTYRYAAQEAGDRLIASLADVYKERRVAVISLIYSKPTDQVKAFADAFRLRKEK
jgi:predicted ArsR family transcriptional regulator